MKCAGGKTAENSFVQDENPREGSGAGPGRAQKLEQGLPEVVSIRKGPCLTSCLQSRQDSCLWEQIQEAVYVNLDLLLNNLEYILLVDGSDFHLGADHRLYL